ncbi:MAG: hypothetical protein AMXMBFR79_01050 [Chitinophagaceae bacterium]|nr:hypothetical protein [Chitinophagaceae bacterium]MCZ2299570.1 hypothetical protein [Chitinophagales bacterium]
MQENKRNVLIKYASMATQLLVGLGLTTWLGTWLDKKMTTKKPMATWILPMTFLIGFLVKLIKDTNKK